MIIFSIFETLPWPLPSLCILDQYRSPSYLFRDLELLTCQICDLVCSVSLTDSCIDLMPAQKLLLALFICSCHWAGSERCQIHHLLHGTIDDDTNVHSNFTIRACLLGDLRFVWNLYLVSCQEGGSCEDRIHSLESFDRYDFHSLCQCDVGSFHNTWCLWNPHSNTVKQVPTSGDSSLIGTHLPPSSCRFIYRLIWKTHALSLRVRHIYNGAMIPVGLRDPIYLLNRYTNELAGIKMTIYSLRIC